MKNSTILIAVGKDAPTAGLAARLEVLREMSARAVVLIVTELPVFPYYAVGIPPYGATDVPAEWQAEMAASKEALKAQADEIEALLQQHGVSGDVAAIACEPSAIADAVAQHAILCDMALIGDELRETDALFRQIVHAVLFQSPVGLMLNDQGAAALRQPKRAFVAWNTELHAARAVHLALPVLRHADDVTIATFDPVMNEYREGEDPGVDVAKWLTHHGCNVTVQQYPSGGQDIGHCIVERAQEVGADLIVMGAYGHSRMRQAIFGGTTRSLIEQTKQAVFLAH